MRSIMLVPWWLLGTALAGRADAQQTQPPAPVTAATAIELCERGALLVEGFDAPEMNAKLWRIARDELELEVEVRAGAARSQSGDVFGLCHSWGPASVALL